MIKTQQLLFTIKYVYSFTLAIHFHAYANEALRSGRLIQISGHNAQNYHKQEIDKLKKNIKLIILFFN